MIGRQFTRLTVLSYAEYRNNKHDYWTVKCSCGTIKSVEESNLLKGRQKSCGCLRRENKPPPGTHGLTNSGSYSSWSHMKDRCNNSNHIHYKYYGGRGIGYISTWESFENFYKDMGDRPAGYSLERKDNNLGYSKTNCIWATPKQQANNRR